MADAAEKLPEQPKDEKSGGEASAPKKRKKDLLTLLIFALTFVNLLVMGGMGYFLTKMATEIKGIQEPPVPVVEHQSEKHESLGKELEPKELGVLYALDGFLVNLAGGTGPKFLQVQMELELGNPEVEEEISRKKAAIRDAIIVLLSSRTYNDLRKPNGIKKIRKELQTIINNLLTTGTVRDVYFTQFHFN